LVSRNSEFQDFFDRLGEAIWSRRKRLGMSQEELAESCGVDRAFISDVENGKRNPSVAALAKIAYGLGWKLSKLIAQCEE